MHLGIELHILWLRLTGKWDSEPTLDSPPAEDFLLDLANRLWEDANQAVNPAPVLGTTGVAWNAKSAVETPAVEAPAVETPSMEETTDFAAAKQALRDSPFFAETLTTGSVMFDQPSAWGGKRPNVEFLKVILASRRLDWLIRGALEFEFEQTIMSPRHVSAIDDFLRFIDANKPDASYLTEAVQRHLQKRLEFCAKILQISKAECTFYQRQQAVGSRWFEQMVRQHGFTLDDVVYQNPFKFRLYTGVGQYYPATTDRQLLDFHFSLLDFWH